MVEHLVAAEHGTVLVGDAEPRHRRGQIRRGDHVDDPGDPAGARDVDAQDVGAPDRDVTSATCSAPGKRRSATKRCAPVVPVVRRRTGAPAADLPPGRTVRRLAQLVALVAWPAPEPSSLARRRSRGRLHRAHDALVAGAAAQVARQRLADLGSSGDGLVRSRYSADTTWPGMQKPHWTAPALRNSSCRSVSPSADEPLDGGDLVPLGLAHSTRQVFTALAVEQHGARAALALGAAALGPRQPHLVAERVDQRAVGGDGDRCARCR